MKLLIACLAVIALLVAPAAMACPPVVDPAVDPSGGGSFSFGAGYGADMCEAPAPMIAGNFGVGAGYGGGASFGIGGYGGGAMFAAPSYSASFAAPAYATQVVRQRIVAAPAYGYGGFAGRRFGGFRGGYGTVVAAPVVRQRIVAAPIYTGFGVAAPVYGAAVSPVLAVPVRAPGPIRGALQGFRGGLRNRLNGF